MDSEEDAEYIVGKAIRDGVIEGRIVHEKGWMESGTQKSGYGPEVSEIFGRRIAFCLDLHNQSVKVGFLFLSLFSFFRLLSFSDMGFFDLGYEIPVERTSERIGCC